MEGQSNDEFLEQDFQDFQMVSSSSRLHLKQTSSLLRGSLRLASSRNQSGTPRPPSVLYPSESSIGGIGPRGLPSGRGTPRQFGREIRDVRALTYKLEGQNQRIKERLPSQMREDPVNFSYTLSGKGLYQLPASCFHLRGLRVDFSNQELDLSDNLLEALPPALYRQLTSLESLNISKNRFQWVSDKCWGCLQKLKNLNLSFNLFKEVPFGSGQLRALKRLDLRGNPLTELPKFLFDDFQGLESLFLEWAFFAFQTKHLKITLLETVCYFQDRSIPEAFFDMKVAEVADKLRLK